MIHRAAAAALLMIVLLFVASSSFTVLRAAKPAASSSAPAAPPASAPNAVRADADDFVTAADGPPVRVKPSRKVAESDIDSFLRSRSVDSRMMIIPVNSGYLEMTLNLLCSLERTASKLVGGNTTHVGSQQRSGGDAVTNGDSYLSSEEHKIGKGFVFAAVDPKAEAALRQLGLPVYREPGMDSSLGASAEYGSQEFKRVACSKLVLPIRTSALGLQLVFSDADIAFAVDPAAYLPPPPQPLISNNGTPASDLTIQLARCDLSTVERGPMNTGFYVAEANSVIATTFRASLRECPKWLEDQDALNQVIAEGKASSDTSHEVAQLKQLRVAYLDGCLFRIGCLLRPPYDKQHCSRRDSGVEAPRLVMAHVCYYTGKKAKRKKLIELGLWDSKCIRRWKNTIPY